MPQTIFLSFAVMSWVVTSVVLPIIAGYWTVDFVDERFFEGTSRTIFGVVVVVVVALFTFSVVVGTGYEIVKNYTVTKGENDVPNVFLLLAWIILPMVIVSLVTKKFAECYLREAKPVIIGIVSSIVTLMIFGATIGGTFVGIYLTRDGNLNGNEKTSVESTETVENERTGTIENDRTETVEKPEDK